MLTFVHLGITSTGVVEKLSHRGLGNSPETNIDFIVGGYVSQLYHVLRGAVG